MNKLNVAVIFGGCSSEYSVSLESSYSVLCNLNPEKYCLVPIGITHEGEWFYFTGSFEQVRDDAWHNEQDCVPAVFSPNRGDHRLLLLYPDHTDSVPVDVVLPILHGRNGEDGTVQGMLALADIPLAGCGVMASAICMDKDRAHTLAHAAGVNVPESMVLETYSDTAEAVAFAERIGFPLFVKPVKAGSSYGVTKVTDKEKLLPAIELAFQYDDQVIVEQNIDGFEVGCAVLGNSELMVGEVDEIELAGGFFDFTEKYNLITSSIHVPARISAEKSAEIKELAKVIYRALGCSGFARVDMFLTPEGKVYFNEINTIPGFTAHSRYPSMMKAAGHSFPEILDRIIALALER